MLGNFNSYSTHSTTPRNSAINEFFEFKSFLELSPFTYLNVYPKYVSSYTLSHHQAIKIMMLMKQFE